MAIESIGSVLKKKGHEICSVAPDATVHDAIALMAAKNVAAVLVISEGHLVGILSARDYGRKVVLGREILERRAGAGDHDNFCGYHDSRDDGP